jgi:PGF-CTERM protein
VTQPDPSVTDASLDAATVALDEQVTVTATVENRGSGEGSRTVALVVGGETRDTATVTVPPGETKTVTFTLRASSPGEHEVAVGGATAGTLAVESEGSTTTATQDATTTDSGGQPGFGVGVALLALVAAALLARRRRAG